MFGDEFARGGPILNSAIDAIEIALWDIVGTALDRPVHDRLGGMVRDRLPAYANAWYGTGATLDKLGRAAAQVAAKGYRGLKFDPLSDAGRAPDAKSIRAAAGMVACVRDAIGLIWHYCRPPIEELAYEKDVRGVRVEHVLTL